MGLEMSFEDFQYGHRGGHFAYKNASILANLYLHVGLLSRIISAQSNLCFWRCRIYEVNDRDRQMDRSITDSRPYHKQTWISSILLWQIQVWLLPNRLIRIIAFCCPFISTRNSNLLFNL